MRMEWNKRSNLQHWYKYWGMLTKFRSRNDVISKTTTTTPTILCLRCDWKKKKLICGMHFVIHLENVFIPYAFPKQYQSRYKTDIVVVWNVFVTWANKIRGTRQQVVRKILRPKKLIISGYFMFVITQPGIMCPLSIVRFVHCRTVQFNGNMASMGQRWYAYRFLVVKHLCKCALGRPSGTLPRGRWNWLGMMSVVDFLYSQRWTC